MELADNCWKIKDILRCLASRDEEKPFTIMTAEREGERERRKSRVKEESPEKGEMRNGFHLVLR